MTRIALHTGLIVLLASTAAAQTTEQSCVDVRIGNERAYDCINRQLENSVPRSRFSSSDAPLTAASPPNAVGTFNQAATAQQLGTSFGHSVTPQRPPAPVFANPMVPGR